MKNMIKKYGISGAVYLAFVAIARIVVEISYAPRDGVYHGLDGLCDYFNQLALYNDAKESVIEMLCFGLCIFGILFLVEWLLYEVSVSKEETC